MPFYHVAQPNEYLCVTGVGIDDVKVVKKWFKLPGQTINVFTLTPKCYVINLNGMSLEKLEFRMPGVFTIGPKNEMSFLINYARKLADGSNVDEIVRGIVEGECRVICARLTMEELFKERKLFKENVLKVINTELEMLGMVIYNANLKEIEDTPGSEYFKYARMKTQEGAVNSAKVEVAKARMMGNVGEKEAEAKSRKFTSQIEADTNKVEQETQITIEKGLAEVKTMDAKYETEVNLAQIEAQNKTELLEEQFSQKIEAQKAIVAQEKERAEQISKAAVEAEVIQALADADFYKSNAEADANLYREMQNAKAEKLMFEAQSTGIKALQKAFNGDNNATLKYVMFEQGLHVDIAKIQASAIEELEPTITVWEKDEETDEIRKTSNEDTGLKNLMQTLPPLLAVIRDQTGIEPPTWLGSYSMENK